MLSFAHEILRIPSIYTNMTIINNNFSINYEHNCHVGFQRNILLFNFSYDTNFRLSCTVFYLIHGYCRPSYLFTKSIIFVHLCSSIYV